MEGYFRMKPLLVIQNCEAESAGTIITYLDEKKHPHQTVRSFEGERPPGPSEFSAVINLGTPDSAASYFEHDYLKAVFSLVAEVIRTDVPYLGICFGAQILARALGAQVMPNKVKEIGTYTVRLTNHGKRDPLFAGFEDEFPVFHWHGDTFRLPFEALLLAEGTDCRNQAFRKRRAVGLQFHLEVDPDDVPRWCELYKQELDEVGKTDKEVQESYRNQAERVRLLNYRLLDNFISTL